MDIRSIGNKIKGNPTMIDGTVYSMLIICSISHFLNDMIQSIIPSIYPIVKDKFDFSFAQIGIITLIFQMTSSILQPFTGLYADKRPQPYALSIGMCFTLVGLLLLAFAENYFLILLAVSIVGLGSSVFHPTASRVAQMASGGKKSLAQSIFQVGGNGGGGGAIVGCHHHPAIRATSHLIFCSCSLACSHHHGQAWSMVQGTTGLCGQPSAAPTASQHSYLQASEILGLVHPHHARILEVLLHRLHHQLLHLLPD